MACELTRFHTLWFTVLGKPKMRGYAGIPQCLTTLKNTTWHEVAAIFVDVLFYAVSDTIVAYTQYLKVEVDTLIRWSCRQFWNKISYSIIINSRCLYCTSALYCRDFEWFFFHATQNSMPRRILVCKPHVSQIHS